MNEKMSLFEIVATGEELLQGRTVDTNTAYIAQSAATVGFSLARVTTVGDGEDDIADAIEKALARTGLVVVTGGLGPTEDDRTRDAAARVFGKPLVTNEESLARLEGFWKRRGRPMPQINEVQARFPEDAEVWRNPIGTADGFRCSGASGEAVFIPGVPHEALAMTDRLILPWLAAKNPDAVFRSVMIRTFGLPESEMAMRLAGFPAPDSGIALIYGANFPEIKLTLSARGENAAEVEARIERARDELRGLLGGRIYSEDGRDMAETVAELLKQSGRTIAVAESCTGGMVAAALTDVPGSSAYFVEGRVTYANVAKIRALGVSEETLATFGAVSEECAKEMAEGILEKAGTDFALSVTGIAGPDGGTPEKPVGTVFLAFAAKGEETRTYYQRFTARRDYVRKLSTFYALDLIRRKLGR